MPPVNISPPVLTGDRNENAILTTTDGVWDAPYYLTFYWMRNGQLISGVSLDARIYKVAVTSDRGAMISVRVRAQYGIGNTDDASSTSNAIGPILADPATNPPINISPPVLTGLPNVASVLTTTDGVWQNPPLRVDYWWKRNGGGIGGDSRTYRLVDADLGAIISVEVQAFSDGGVQMSPLSNAVGPILPEGSIEPPVIDIPPTVYMNTPGTPSIGGYIYSSDGTWERAIPTGFEYEWLRNGSLITGATDYFYSPTADDEGAMTSSVVIGSNAAGKTRAPSSNTVGPVAGPPQPRPEVEAIYYAQLSSDIPIGHGDEAEIFRFNTILPGPGRMKALRFTISGGIVKRDIPPTGWLKLTHWVGRAIDDPETSEAGIPRFGEVAAGLFIPANPTEFIKLVPRTAGKVETFVISMASIGDSIYCGAGGASPDNAWQVLVEAWSHYEGTWPGRRSPKAVQEDRYARATK
jgi:hypothetical protein